MDRHMQFANGFIEETMLMAVAGVQNDDSLLGGGGACSVPKVLHFRSLGSTCTTQPLVKKLKS